jgi:protein SCO1
MSVHGWRAPGAPRGCPWKDDAVRLPWSLTALGAALALATAVAGCGGSSGATGATTPAQGPAALGQLPTGLRDTPAPRVALNGLRGGGSATPAPFETASLHGRPYFVTFLYVHCTSSCPLIGEELRATLQRLGPQARRVAVVAVSVQPQGDTPAAVHDWLKLHHEPANFHYLIGSRAELAPVWKAWFTSPQPGGKGPSIHTAAVWVVDAKGHRVAEVPAGAAIDPGQLAAEARKLLP